MINVLSGWRLIVRLTASDEAKPLCPLTSTLITVSSFNQDSIDDKLNEPCVSASYVDTASCLEPLS